MEKNNAVFSELWSHCNGLCAAILVVLQFVSDCNNVFVPYFIYLKPSNISEYFMIDLNLQ